MTPIASGLIELLLLNMLGIETARSIEAIKPTVIVLLERRR